MLQSPKEFTMALRHPCWVGENFTVKINGRVVSEDVIAPLREVPESGRQLDNRSLQTSGSYVELKRVWKNGDTVSLTLHKTLRLEPLPDNPRRVAIMWGPLVLAGDLGPEQRRERGRNGRYGRPRAPVFIAAERPVEEWLKPVPNKNGHFRTDGVGRENDVDFVPFYRLHRRTYAVYWDLFTPSEWEVKAAEYAAERERQRKLELATVAYAQPGEMQPERDYNYQGAEDARVTRVEGRPGRRARSWFSFDLPVEPSGPMALIVTYYSEERRRGPARFEILVDDERIAEQEITRSSPARFFDIVYAISEKLVKGKKKVNVRFQAIEGNSVAGVFGIRMVRADAK
jgi:hypothetical protein